MNITPATPAAPAAPLGGVQKTQAPSAPAKAEALRPSDRLELSGASHLLQLAKSGEARMENIQAIRAQIDAGKYDLDARADIVADRLLDELGL